jgi:hypothetical protein
MTTVRPPGSGTLADEIVALRKRIVELSRKTDKVPLCRARLDSDVALAAGDNFAFESWSAEEDDLGMFVNPTTGKTYIEIPFDGPYYVHFHAEYASLAAHNTMASKVYANDTVGVATGAIDVPSFGADAHVDALRSRVTLAAGDRLTWSVYANTAFTLRASAWSGVLTEITVKYDG